MYQTKANLCWRCGKTEGTLIHVWWTCEKIKSFWNTVYDELKKMFKYNSMKNTAAFLLGITVTGIAREDQKIFLYATGAARILIAKNWKKETVPTKKEWQDKLLEYIELARLTEAIRDHTRQEFQKAWGKCREYFTKQCPKIHTWTCFD